MWPASMSQCVFVSCWILVPTLPGAPWHLTQSQIMVRLMLGLEESQIHIALEVENFRKPIFIEDS